MPKNDLDIEHMIEKTMDKLSGQLKEREKPAVEKMLRKVFIDGKTPKEAIGLTEKELETMYSYGYNLFTHGKFKDARLMMEHLLSLDPQERYALGCGASFHQLKDYERAAGYYLLAFQLSKEEQNPLPLYYAYDCFKNLNELRSAALMLEYTIGAAGDKPEHAILKERAMRTRESVFRDIRDNEQKAAEEKQGQDA